MEPHVSLPMLNPTKPATVAEAEPAEDPLEPCSTFQGLRVLPPNQTSPHASAPSVSLAINTAPASSSRRTTVASYGICCSSNGFAPHVVRYSSSASRSLAPHGMPCSGPRHTPRASSASARWACRSARSSVSVITHSSLGPWRSSRSRYIRVNSTEVTWRVWISSERSVSDQNATSSRLAGRVTRVRRVRRRGRRGISGSWPAGIGSNCSAGYTSLGIERARISSYDSRFSLRPSSMSSRSASLNSRPASASAWGSISLVTRPSPSASAQRAAGKAVPEMPRAAHRAKKRRRSMGPWAEPSGGSMVWSVMSCRE